MKQHILRFTAVLVFVAAPQYLYAQGQYDAEIWAKYLNGFDSSAAAQQLLTQILAEQTLSDLEAGFALRMLTNGQIGGPENHDAAIRQPEFQSVLDQIGQKNRRVALTKKMVLGDNTQWTDEDIARVDFPAASQRVALYGAITDPFVKRVIDLQKGRGYADITWQTLFKNYRRTLSLSDQIALTNSEIGGLTTIVRNADQDAWLEALAFDVIVLQELQ